MVKRLPYQGLFRISVLLLASTTQFGSRSSMAYFLNLRIDPRRALGHPSQTGTSLISCVNVTR
jgi:hypothetical protein